MKQERTTLKGLLVVMAIFWVMMLLPSMSIAGPLDPPASAVDAGGNPVSTTQELPSWSKKIVGAERFVLVLDGAGVLDRETGLVWEQSPEGGTGTSAEWKVAMFRCANLNIGGRKGWHLATIEQLASLVDTSVSTSPKLPSGHPFTNVESALYWSATTYASDATSALGVGFGSGNVLIREKLVTLLGNYWCVRGTQSYDGY